MSWHLIGGTSDNATAVLAGRDMVHGNVLLHGWHLGADSFLLLDIPLLGLEAKLGLGPRAFHVVPTVLAVCTVVVAVVYAARQANRRNAAIAAVVTFLIIGLPSSLFAAFFLQGPIHVMTTLCCLVAFGLLTPGARRQRQVGGALLLLIAVSSDPLAFVIGIVPGRLEPETPPCLPWGEGFPMLIVPGRHPKGIFTALAAAGLLPRP